MGECYLDLKYYDQALDHLQEALRINQLLPDTDEYRQITVYLLVIIGKSHIEMGKCDDAMEVLEQAYNLNKEKVGEDNISNANMFLQMGHALVKKPDLNRALYYFQKVFS